MRGSRPEGVLVLVDGVPINDPLTGAADLSSLPAYGFESATAVLGAGGGFGASAGVLSLRTRTTPDVTTGNLTLGSFGHVAADLSSGTAGRIGTLTVSGQAVHTQNDYPFANRVLPGEPLERRRNADRQALHATVAGRLNKVPLSAVGRVDAIERGSPGRMGTRLFDDARWREVTGQLTLGAEVNDATRIRAAYARRHQLYSDPRFDREESLIAERVGLHGDWGVESSSRWLLSGHLERESVSGDVLEASSIRWTGGLTASADVGSSSFQVTPSLSTDFGGLDIAISPAIVVVGRPSDRWRLWGRAGQAFRLPTFADLYLASSYQVRANQDLEPERVRLDAEVGLEWNARTLRARSQIGAFFRQTVDPIVWMPSSTAIWSPRNAGRLDAVGVEGAGEISPGAGWQLRFAATWTRSRVHFGGEGMALPYQPTWAGQLALRRTAGPREATVRMRYTGSRTAGIATPHELPPHAVLDLAGRQTIRTNGPDLEVEIGIRNLLNARYELVELFPEPGRQFMLRLGLRTRSTTGLPPVAESRKMNDEHSRARDIGSVPAGSAGPPDGNPTGIPPS
jgi:hypothetical protein